MLVAWKMEQDMAIEALGGKYANYNLVIASPMGIPTEAPKIRKSMKELIEKNNLPPVVFHSLRHSSIIYKLKLTGGDIKAVQGDSGQAQAQMVTDQYSHILDDSVDLMPNSSRRLSMMAAALNPRSCRSKPRSS